MLGLTLVVLAAVVAGYTWLLAMSYDREFARIRGLPVDALHIGLLVLIAVAVVLFVRVVGLILVIALMTIAPYLAERWARSLGQTMGLACGFNLAFALVGMALAYRWNLTTGPTIILVATLAFLLVTVGERLFRRRRPAIARG